MKEPAWRERHRMRPGYYGGVPLQYCRECKGDTLSKTLTKHCPGRMLTDEEEAGIRAGTLEFMDGRWERKK